MKKTIIYSLVLLFGVQFTACKDDEVLTPSGINDNVFAVPDDATGPEADLRREFYKETGIYLLFDENLRTTVVGKDSQGNDIIKTETVDFAWDFTSYDDYLIYESGYITDIEDMRKAADLFRDNVLPHIQGSKLAPYSIVLFNGLQVYDDYEDEWNEAYTLPCWRSLGVNVAGWVDAENDEEIAQYTAGLCKSLVGAKFNYTSSIAKPFTDLSDEYSGEKICDYEEDWDRTDMSMVYSYGYMTYVKRNKVTRDYFPYTEDDFQAFLDAVFDRSKEDFEAEFGDYPAIMEKYNIMRSLIEQTGYKL